MRWAMCVLIGIGLLLVLGCKEEKAPTTAGLTVQDLQKVPTQLIVNGRTLVLETYLWRDFMPGPDTPPAGRPLIAAITLKATDGQPLPAGLDMDHLWVVKDEKNVWSTAFSQEDRPANPNALEKVARGDPLWEPGTTVQIVVRITGLPAGTGNLLRVADQTIQRTD